MRHGLTACFLTSGLSAVLGAPAPGPLPASFGAPAPGPALSAFSLEAPTPAPVLAPAPILAPAPGPMLDAFSLMAPAPAPYALQAPELAPQMAPGKPCMCPCDPQVPFPVACSLVCCTETFYKFRVMLVISVALDGISRFAAKQQRPSASGV